MDVRVACFTNLDEYRFEQWPAQMACRPVVGDYVLSKTGKRLRVVAVAHEFANNEDAGPRLSVELHR